MSKAYQCMNCGGTRVFDPKSGTLKCPNCDSMEEIAAQPQDTDHPLSYYDEALRLVTGQETSQKGHETMSCSSCGAVIEMAENATATTCPYCDSPIVLAEKQLSHIPPDGVLPFKIAKSEVDEIFRNWLKGRWLAPNSLKRLAQKGQIQSMYLPFWVFDADVDCDYTAQGGTHYQETYQDSEGQTRTRTRTEWEFTRGHVRQFFDDVAILASRSVDANLARDVRNCSTNATFAFDDRYLAGHGSELYGIEMPEAHQTARTEMENGMYSLVRQDVLRYYDEVSNISMDLDFSDETYKQLLLPIYITAYGFKGKIYQVLVNGETGEISGEYPKSYIKIALLVIVVAGLLALFYYLTQ